MTKPFLKFYLMKNPAFGVEKEPFVAPTKEEYEEYLNIVCSGKAITPYERYVERAKEYHEIEEGEMMMANVAVFPETEDDMTKQIESEESFIKWLEYEEF